MISKQFIIYNHCRFVAKLIGKDEVKEGEFFNQRLIDKDKVIRKIDKLDRAIE